LIEQQTGIPATIYGFKHYHIVSMDDVVDIISNSQPIVELFRGDVRIETSAISEL
jgi:hypothetical protein